jgi:hypothetical protein
VSTEVDSRTPCDGDDFAASSANLISSFKGALLATRFRSLDELKSVVRIEYFKGTTQADSADSANTMVRLTYCTDGQTVVSTLKKGISEADLSRGQEGDMWDKLWLGANSVYTVLNRMDLKRISILGRRRSDLFTAGDVAFYDLAEATVAHISSWDSSRIELRDFSEKGYLNTFNHVTAQALMTSIFAEGLADFMADVHERLTMPELVTGMFTADQLKDSVNNPMDNYVDLLNNELGQELGKKLKEKCDISSGTFWTPELLTEYLNETQNYYTWSFQIGFRPFRPDDELVVRFARKINAVLRRASQFN